ncbi:hypothetical protein HF072_13925 [Bacillus sp. RO3]|nr:hypothetical protein [Bacillus sp. RO3]
MKKGLLIKLMTVLFLSTFFLYGFSHLGVFAYEKIFIHSLTLSQDAAVASIHVGGKSKEEAKRELSDRVEEWKLKQTITLVYNGEKVLLDSSIIQFHLDESIEKLGESKNTRLMVSIDQDIFHTFLSDHFMDYKAEENNIEALQEYILSLAETLQSEDVINITDYITSSQPVQIIYEAVSNELDITPIIKSFIENYPAITIGPNSQFSFSDFLESEGFNGESQQGLSPVTGLLYQISLHSNFSIIERNISKQLPVHATLGLEAKFDPENNQDFVMTNPNSTEYELKFFIEGNTVRAQLHGIPFPNTFNVRLSDKETFAPRVIKQFSPFVELGDVNVEQEGKDGVLIRVYRQKLNSLGETLSEELINEDFYAPQHKIAIYPLEESSKTSSETDYDNVPNKDNEEEQADSEPSEGEDSENQSEDDTQTGSHDKSEGDSDNEDNSDDPEGETSKKNRK